MTDLQNILENIQPLVLNGALVSYIGMSAYVFWTGHKLKKIRQHQKENMKEGFIHPEDLEVRCMDIDMDGKYETVAKVGDKTYLLRQPENQDATLVRYKV